ncbi:hypothetical protein IE53DRAFT_400805 [Violaceomyces palustris]|uniref:Uncharacterized protein n=1 Tax=Violaceomyces palustris TaxID=1673888 RepID=A0ACD0P4R0_9BASI|nr:hypothetical protein IE53DRAFT_400805 [Violaceomyces palustris]
MISEKVPDQAEAIPQATTTHGYKPLEETAKWKITPQSFTDDEKNDFGTKREDRIGYLEGLRGLLAFEVLLWTFFRILSPAMVTDTDLDGTRPASFVQTSPEWQSVLRKVLSPLFWDGTLQATFFFVLSGRVVSQTFVERRTATTLAGAAFRRPIRLLIPVSVALALTSILVATGSFSAAQTFSKRVGNAFAQPPPIWESTIQYFYTLVGYFFDTSDSMITTGMLFFQPRGIIWFIPRVFMESYTIYTFSYLLPFTVTKWKFIFLGVFTLALWWIGSFGWYSLTGLTLTELVVVYDLPSLARQGICLPLPRFVSRWRSNLTLSTYIPPVTLLGLGTLLKYLWATKFYDQRNDEIVWHASQTTGGFNTGFEVTETAYPRLDDWFLVAGSFYLLEMGPGLVRRLFDNPILKHLGRISFSLFLVSGMIIMSLGPLIQNHLFVSQGWRNESGILGVCFVSLVPLCLISAEIFHRLIDEPSCLFARFMFKWMKED